MIVIHLQSSAQSSVRVPALCAPLTPPPRCPSPAPRKASPPPPASSTRPCSAAQPRRRNGRIVLILLNAHKRPPFQQRTNPVVPEPAQGSRILPPGTTNCASQRITAVGLPVRWCLSLARTTERRTPGTGTPRAPGSSPLLPHRMYSHWARKRPGDGGRLRICPRRRCRGG